MCYFTPCSDDSPDICEEAGVARMGRTLLRKIKAVKPVPTQAGLPALAI